MESATIQLMWEVDWSNPKSNGTYVWSRNPTAKRKDSRRWRLRGTGFLRSRGVKTPVYRKDSWEIDWSKRNKKLVWARNTQSKMPEAREWHWIDFHQVEQAGQTWRPKIIRTGRWIGAGGYVLLSRGGMSSSDVLLAEKHNLFRGRKKFFVKEHQLVALKKYGAIPTGSVVRHLNGDKKDNRPENLVLGTHEENIRDHEEARVAAMLWRERAEALGWK